MQIELNASPKSTWLLVRKTEHHNNLDKVKSSGLPEKKKALTKVTGVAYELVVESYTSKQMKQTYLSQIISISESD